MRISFTILCVFLFHFKNLFWLYVWTCIYTIYQYHEFSPIALLFFFFYFWNRVYWGGSSSIGFIGWSMMLTLTWILLSHHSAEIMWDRCILPYLTFLLHIFLLLNRCQVSNCMFSYLCIKHLKQWAVSAAPPVTFLNR